MHTVVNNEACSRDVYINIRVLRIKDLHYKPITANHRNALSSVTLSATRDNHDSRMFISRTKFWLRWRM